MEKLPKQNSGGKDEKLVIGDQTFERVGEVEAQETEFIDAPKTEEVYFDIENGALASKLPIDDFEYESYKTKATEEKAHKEFQEKRKNDGLRLKEQAEGVEIDLSRFSAEDLHGILYLTEEYPARVVLDEDLQMRNGEYVLTSRTFEEETGHFSVDFSVRSRPGSRFAISQIKKANSDSWDEDRPLARAVGKNLVEIDGHEGKIRFSFLEIPTAYTKYIEKLKKWEEG